MAGRLPDWFKERFPAEYHRKRLFDERPEALLHVGAPRVSSPERAFLELLSEVGVRQPLQEARELVESSYSLRADVLSELLQRCTSVKTVRLCLQLGREGALPWVDKLEPDKLPTGSDRPWVSNGRRPAGAQAMNPVYLYTARLLTQVAPLVFVDDTFALKAVRPSTSRARHAASPVDLDLIFPDHTLSRELTLVRINDAIRQAAERLSKRGFQTHAPAAEAGETKLLVRRGRTEVKIEVNFVLRGTVQPVRRASLTPVARDVLMADLDIPVAVAGRPLRRQAGRCAGPPASTRPIRRDATFRT